MRKLIAIVLLLILCGSLIGTVYAAEAGISVTDGNGMPGDTVYLAVKLSGAAKGSSIGITYSYDTAVLESLPEFCTWNNQGVLQDFDEKNNGVWATDTAKDLNGTVCVLAFRILPNAKFTETTVQCTVAVQNGAQEVGQFTGTATVRKSCNHDYGNWTDGGSIGHVRECRLCQGKQTQSHSWNDGTVRTNPNSTQTDWKVYTCTVCGGEKQVEIPKDHSASEEPTTPTPTETMPPLHVAPSNPAPEKRPDTTQPTNPNWKHDPEQEDYPDSSKDNQSPFHDYNSEPLPTDEHGHILSSGYEHSGEYGEETFPLIIPSNQDSNTSDPHAGHDHDEILQSVSNEHLGWKVLMVIAIIGAMVGAGTYYVKKKK